MNEQNRGFFTFLLLYRWLNWLLAVVLLYLGATPPLAPALVVVVYATVFAYNTLFTIWPLRVEHALRRYPLLLLGDVLFCSLLLLAYGWRSPFTVYSFSPVMLGGYLFRARGGFIAAAFGALGYALVTAINGRTWAWMERAGEFDSYLFHIFDYFLIAIFFTYPAVLAERLRQSNTELQAAQDKIERLVLDKERQRIAGEIHDGVTQSLLGVKMLIEDSLARTGDREIIERLVLAKEAAGKAIEQARAAIDDLFEERFSRRSLSEIAEDALGNLGRAHDIAVSFRAEGQEGELSTKAKKALYMIIEETVANIIKHSGASKVEATLRFDGGAINLDIVDDGAGFDPDASRSGGYGLSTMSQRAQHVSGDLTISSTPGRGTRISLTVPQATTVS